MELFKRVVAVISIFCLILGLDFSTCYSLPEGEQVISGNASFEQTDSNALNISASDKAIINYNSFNIAEPETVRFIQPSSAALALNRVIGINPSDIYGSLLANGQIFLVNPNGIFFGPTAKIDAGSFLASTLDITDNDFLSGNYKFSLKEGCLPSSIINRGSISVSPEGYVVLASPLVSQEGVIVANCGKVIIAGTSQFAVDLNGDGLINFVVSDADNEDGTILIAQDKVSDLIKEVVNTNAIVEAGQVIEENGVVRLVGIEGLAINSGSIKAQKVTIDSGSHGTSYVSGNLDVSNSDLATQAQGGEVRILGNKVGLFDADIDAFGDNGGGTVLIGGNFQGKGPEANSFRTFVSRETNINADAISNGDGGKVIIWSDDITRDYGSVTARGGAESGNGGLVEISGKRLLKFDGEVDLGTPYGIGGILLFDPLNITISTAADANTDGFTAGGDNTEAFADDAGLDSVFDVDNPGGSFINVGDGNTITLQATNDITVSNAFNVGTATGNANVNLILQAGNDIYVNAAVTTTGTGTINLSADDNTPNGAGNISIGAAGSLVTANQSIALTAVTLSIAGGGTINSGSGAITISPSQASTVGLGAGAGTLNITDVEFNAITTSGTLTIGGANATAIVVDTLTVPGTVTGALALTATNAGGAGGTITFSGGDSTTTADLTLTARDGVTLSRSVTSAGATTIDADQNDGGVGDFSVANAMTLSTTGNTLSITANDITLTGTGALNSGAAATTLLVSDAGTIGLGDTAGNYTLSGAELQNITATGLTIGNNTNGAITVDNITAANSNNITGTVTLVATLDNSTITFATAASTFNALTANADAGIAVNIGVTTDTGALTLEGDADNAADTNDNIAVAAGVTVTSATAMTLDATTGGITGAGALILNANSGITLNNNLTGAGTTTIDTDVDNNGTGDLTVAAGATIDTGANTLNITANDITLTGNINNTGNGPITIDVSQAAGTIGIEDATKTMNLTDAKLDNITTTGTITIGSATNAGGITIGTDAALTQAAKNFEFITTGILTTAGNAFTTTGNVVNTADNITLGVALNANNVTLRPATAARTIAVNDATGNLSLTDAELDFITATGTLTIGSATAGDISIGSIAGLTQNKPLIFNNNAGTITLNNDITTTGASAITMNDNVVLAEGLTVTLSTGAAIAGNIQFDGKINGTAGGGAENLTLVSGTGTTTVTGAIGDTTALGTLTLQSNTGTETGAATFNGNVTAATLTTFGQAYAVALNEDATITNACTFLNTGALTLGNGADDNLTFANGVDATAPAALNIAGTIAATVAASTISLGDGDTVVAVTASANIGGAATGLIDIGDATLADGATLTVGTGIANAINLDAVTGTAGLAASNLTINTTGAVAVAEAVGTDIGVVTITMSGGTIFTGTVAAATVAITDSTDATTVSFLDNLTATTAMTVAANGAYHVSITGGTNAITGTTTFSNTGNVTIGDAAGDTTTFASGLVATAPAALNIAGTIAATVAASTISLGDGDTAVAVTASANIGGAATGLIDIGDATLADGATLTVGTGIANAINLDAVTGTAGLAASNLTINTTGAVAVAEAVGTDIGVVTITMSGGTIFTGTVAAATVAITDSTDATTVSFLDNLTATTAMTVAANGAYHVSITGGTNAITGTTTFSNTGNVTIGDAAGDTTTFASGLVATAPAALNIAGTIAATVAASTISLGDGDTAVAVTASANIGGAATGLIDIGDATLADGATLTVGTGIANAINLDAVTGTAGLAASNLTINTTGAVAVAEAVGTDIGVVTITMSGGTIFTGTVAAATVAITDSTDAATVSFLDNLTATTAMTVAANGAYHVSITGGTNAITGTTTFSNTGNVTIGDAAGDTTTFASGLVATAPAALNIAGTIAATVAASTISLGDGDTAVAVTASANIGGAATGLIDIGDATLADGATLTVGTGIANAINLDAVTGTAGLAASNLTINTTGAVAVAEAVGTDIGVVTITMSGGTIFTGTVAAATVAITDSTDATTVSFLDNLTATTAMTVAANGAYHVSITGGTNAITGTTTFSNTGNVTIGDAAGDTTTFASGLVATAPAALNIAGTIAATVAASTISLGDGDTAVAVTASANIGGAATGLIDIGDATLADGATLTVGTGIANAINLDAVTGTAGLAASNLTINTTGAVAVAEAVGTDIGVVTITMSGGTIFTGTVAAATVAITDSTDATTVSFLDNLTATTAMTVAANGAYHVSITGGTNAITGTTTFSNTGNVTIGDAAGDTTTFASGLVATAPAALNIAGTIAATVAASTISLGDGDTAVAVTASANIGGAATGLIDIGDATLADGATLTVGTGIANAINLDAVTGTAGLAASNLTINTTGAVAVAEAVGTDIGVVTITMSGGTIFTGTVAAATVAITDSTDATTVSFLDNLTATTAMTVAANGAYHVSITGGTNAITGTTTFSNTGNVTIGDAAGDTTTFASGLVATAPAALNIAGTIAATVAASTISLGDGDTAVAVTASANIGGAATGLIDIGDATLADGATLTVGTGIANAINLDAVTGTAGLAASNLTINTTGAVAVAEAVGTDIGVVTITMSGGTIFTGTVAAATVAITDSTDATTVSFLDNLTATTAMTVAANGAYNVSMIGALNIIAGDTNFLNGGTVTLGDNALDVLTFTGGLATSGNGTNPSSTSTGGWIRTASQQMDLGAVTLTAATILDTTNNGAGAGASLNVTGIITGANQDLMLISGGSQTTMSAALNNIADLELQFNNAGCTGAMVFNGDVNATSVTTYGQAYAIAFNEDATITNDCTFLNTNGVTLGNGDDDILLFNGGLDTTAGATTGRGIIRTSSDRTDIAALTISGGTLTLDTTNNWAGAGAILNVTGIVTGGNNNLTLISGNGAITMGAAVNAITTLTLQANNAGATGAVTFNGDVTAATVTTFGQAYAIAFNEDATITNDCTFLNTNGVTLGNGDDDILLFNGGLDTTAGATTGRGIIRTSSDRTDIAALTISGGTLTLDTTNNWAGAGAILNVTGIVTGGNNNLTLISGNGAITMGAAVNAITTLTLQANNAGATGAVTFNGDVTAATVTTFGQAYAIAFNEDATITNDCTFLNTNGVTLGNGDDDILLFNGGLDTTAGATTGRGIIRTSSDRTDIAALTISGGTLTLDTTNNWAGAGAILNVTGIVTGGNNNLTLISGNGAITMGAAVNAITTLTLQANNAGATGAVTFNGDVTAATVTTFGQAYAIAFNEDATITNDCTFLNTNGVTLGNGDDDILLFNGGLDTTAGATTGRGSIRTSGDQMDIAALTLSGGTTTLDATNNGAVAAGAVINLTTVNGTANLALNGGTGGNVTAAGAIGAVNNLTTLTITNANNLGLQAVTTTGAITQTAGTGTSTLNNLLTAGGNVSITTGVITLAGAGSINAGANDVTLTAQTGAITSGVAATDIIADDLTLSAITGIGTAEALLTRVSDLQATNTTSGNIRVNNTGNLNIFGTGVQNTNGSIYITVASDLTLTSSVSGSYVELTASGSILDDSDANAYDVISTGDARLEATTGTIGLPTNPLEVNIGNKLYVSAGGSVDLISIAINGTTSDNLLHLLNNSIGLALLNNRITGGNSLLDNYKQALAQLNPEIGNVFPSFTPACLFIMDDILLEEKACPFEVSWK